MLEFLLLLFIIAILYIPLSGSWQIIKHIRDVYLFPHLPFFKLNPEYQIVVEKYSVFYKMLDENDKKLFRRRMAKFIAMKDFVPRGGLEEVTAEMKGLIGASAIQMTFGLPLVYLSHFHSILVYPDSYYSEISQAYHHGEVNMRGHILLSWKKLAEGFFDPSDGRNLGLHEMAHALHLENAVTNEEYDFLDETRLRIYNEIALMKIEEIRNGSNTFFRAYGGTNRAEFFAVMMEMFFEKPFEFREREGELYIIVSRLINQDPADMIEKFRTRIDRHSEI